MTLIPVTLTPTTLLTGLLVLVAVLSFLLLAARVARISGIATRAADGRRLRIEETLVLDPRRRLHLLACDDRRLLLLTGGSGDVPLGWLPASSGAGTPARRGSAA